VLAVYCWVAGGRVAEPTNTAPETTDAEG